MVSITLAAFGMDPEKISNRFSPYCTRFSLLSSNSRGEPSGPRSALLRAKTMGKRRRYINYTETEKNALPCLACAELKPLRRHELGHQHLGEIASALWWVAPWFSLSRWAGHITMPRLARAQGGNQLCMATQSKHGCRFTFFELHKKYRWLTKTNTDT
jgi:hypothetical protein